ncbi:non-homologous end joining protein Ku [Limnochorda pilosa]|uniref:Non-homologous end joining protein Ku n=1 Tax=Limnochorda pilosa TaxID=1555112 RepID=A0A0K2SNE3_LIMPI|nr:Ku protein [Limnochorda pilosa]BAS28344.1 DNA repair protein [Limnochorda pilosa]
MRSIWKGAISFGLLHIPVKLYPATQERRPHFRLLHRECHTPVEYRRTCPACGKELEGEEIVRGYELAPGSFVTVEDRDLDELPVPSAHTIRLLSFVPMTEIDPLYYQKGYYVEPSEGGGRAYRLLSQVLEESTRAGLARVLLRSREWLAAVASRAGILRLHTLYEAAEIRSPEGLALAPGEAPEPREKELALHLVDQMTQPFRPADFPNRWQEAFDELLRRKLQGEEAVRPAAREAEPAVSDLLSALEKSLQELEPEPAGRGN